MNSKQAKLKDNINESVIDWGDDSPLFRNGVTEENLVDFLKTKLKDRAGKFVFYGSYARGDYNNESDLDLMIILKEETTTPFIERPRDFFDLHDFIDRLDLYVYTPKEFEKLTSESNLKESVFWEDVVREGKVFVV